MKKRGFTLIELLAVIIILAIIALIATPIVMNVISNAKKGTAERSYDNYIRAVQTAVTKKRVNTKISDGTYNVMNDRNLCLGTVNGINCSGTKIEVEASGEDLKNGSTVVIENGEVMKELTQLIIGNYTVTYDNTNDKAVATTIDSN